MIRKTKLSICIILSALIAALSISVAFADRAEPGYIGHASIIGFYDNWIYYTYLKHMKGDVNGSGGITAADARLALRAAARLITLESAQFSLADINEDGTVTALDARKILRIAAKLEPLPEPGWSYWDGLYRIRTDGAGKTQLLDKDELIATINPFNLVFDGDWVYFSNAADNETLYRMRLDCTEKTKLNDDEYSLITLISDGWIYYRRITSANKDTYRIRTDGTGREILRLPDDAGVIGVADSWIYYQEYDENYLCLYKIRMDGTEATKIADDLNVFSLIDGWIYCQSPRSPFGYQIHRLRTDGTDKTQLDDFPLDSYEKFISDGRIYYRHYLNGTSKIRSFALDGTEKIEWECSDLSHILAVEDGWIYYQSNYSLFFEGDFSEWYQIQGTVYKIRTDGSDKQEVIF